MRRIKLSYVIFLLVITGIGTTFVVGQSNELQRVDQKPRRLRETLPPIASPSSSDSATSVPQYRPLESVQDSQSEVNARAANGSAISQAGGRQVSGAQQAQMRLVSHDEENGSGTDNRSALLTGPRDGSSNLVPGNLGPPNRNDVTAKNNPVPASATLSFSAQGTDHLVNPASQSQHIGTMSVNGNGNWNKNDDIPEHVFQGISQIQEPNANRMPVSVDNQVVGQTPGQLSPVQPSPGGLVPVDSVADGQARLQQPDTEGLIPFQPIQAPTAMTQRLQEPAENQSDNIRMSFGSSTAPEQSPLSQAESSAGPQARLALPEEQVARNMSGPANIRYDGSSVQLGHVAEGASHASGEQEGSALPGSHDLVGTQIPQLVIEKIMPNEVQINESMAMKINIRNTGAAKAKDVVLIDRLPKGSRFLEASPSATRDRDGNICWTLGDLNVNEERTVELRIVPTAEGEIGSVATATFSVDASGSTRVTKPGLKMEVNTASDEHLVGGDLILEILISNPGSGVAKNIMIEEFVPEGLSHPKGKKLSATFGDLKPNESKRLKLTLKCERAGETTNYLVAKAENDLIVESKIPIVVLAPGLLLDIVGPKNRYLERKATYELKMENPGSAAAHEVQLVVQLPRGMDFESTDSMGVYDPETHTVHWMLDTLPSRQSGTIRLVTVPREIGEQKIEFVGRTRENLQANATHEVSVDGIASLGFAITNKTGPVELGREAAYEIRVFNRGTKASTNIGLCVQLPEAMRFVDADGPTQFHVSGSVVTFNDLLQLPPQSEKTYTIKAQCLATGDHRVVVQMQSDEMERPVTKEENTNVYGDE